MSVRTVDSLLPDNPALKDYILARGLKSASLLAASAPTEEAFTATIIEDFLKGWKTHKHDPDRDEDCML
eukprot:15997462-Heterocapsa_arctica.AAC.1